MNILTEEKMWELEKMQKNLTCNKSVIFTINMCDCTGWCYGGCEGDCRATCDDNCQYYVSGGNS